MSSPRRRRPQRLALGAALLVFGVSCLMLIYDWAMRLALRHSQANFHGWKKAAVMQINRIIPSELLSKVTEPPLSSVPHAFMFRGSVVWVSMFLPDPPSGGGGGGGGQAVSYSDRDGGSERSPTTPARLGTSHSNIRSGAPSPVKGDDGSASASGEGPAAAALGWATGASDAGRGSSFRELNNFLPPALSSRGFEWFSLFRNESPKPGRQHPFLAGGSKPADSSQRSFAQAAVAAGRFSAGQRTFEPPLHTSSGVLGGGLPRSESSSGAAVLRDGSVAAGQRLARVLLPEPGVEKRCAAREKTAQCTTGENAACAQPGACCERCTVWGSHRTSQFLALEAETCRAALLARRLPLPPPLRAATRRFHQPSRRRSVALTQQLRHYGTGLAISPDAAPKWAAACAKLRSALSGSDRAAAAAAEEELLGRTNVSDMVALQHPAICITLGASICGGSLVLVQEFIEGGLMSDAPIKWPAVDTAIRARMVRSPRLRLGTFS